MLLPFIAAIVASPEQAHATVHIVRAQRVTHEEWRRSKRRREIVIKEGARKVILRLIEVE